MPSPVQQSLKPDSSARRYFWRGVWHIDHSKMIWPLAARNALGISVPLALGLASGHPTAGTLAGLGALNVSFSDGGIAYVIRARRMLLACALVALAVCIGAVAANSVILCLSIAGMWAFSAGLVSALGLVAMDIGMVSLVTLMIFMSHPLPPQQALMAAGLALAGGLLQAGLSLALWPLDRYAPERQVLSNLYLSISQISGTDVPESAGPPSTASLLLAHESLSSLDQDHSPRGECYRSLLTQAQRIRLSIVAVSRLCNQLNATSLNANQNTIFKRAMDGSAQRLANIAAVLARPEQMDSVSDSLLSVNGVAALRDPLDQLAQELRCSVTSNISPLSVRSALQDAALQMETLAGQLRAAGDLASNAARADAAPGPRRPHKLPLNPPASSSAAILLANLSLKSSALRHGLRLAACIVLGELVRIRFGLSHAYWIPMTIALVLKPDFFGTFSRGVLRLAGTLIGLIFATVLIHLLPAHGWMDVVMVGLLALAMRFYGPANYGLFTIAVTGLVVFLLTFSGAAPYVIMFARGIDTLVGGGIALTVYALWPTWEQSQVPQRLAELLHAYRRYFQDINARGLPPLPVPPQVSARSFRSASSIRLASRLARSNLEASVDRLHAEPKTAPEQLKILDGILASSHRAVHAFMAIEAGVESGRMTFAAPAIQQFARDVEHTLADLASALGQSTFDCSSLPDLRQSYHTALTAQRAYSHLGTTGNSSSACPPIFVELDRITNSLNTLAEQIKIWRDMSSQPVYESTAVKKRR